MGRRSFSSHREAYSLFCAHRHQREADEAIDGITSPFDYKGFIDGQPIGATRGNVQTSGFLLDVMRETANVGRARGVALSEDYADQRLVFCDTLPTEMTASMYQDLLPGRRLELPWLSESVSEIGEQLGISVPCNKAMSDILALYVESNESG